MTIDPRIHGIVAGQQYPLLFAAFTGARHYGFRSPDSNFDYWCVARAGRQAEH